MSDPAQWQIVAPDALIAFVAERYGFTLELTGYHLWQRGASQWIASEGVHGFSEQVEAVGIRVSRRPPPRTQLSTAFIRRFCHQATVDVCHLAGDDATAYLQGRSLERPAEEAGERIVFIDGEPVGRGRLRDGLLHCELPKAYRIR